MIKKLTFKLLVNKMKNKITDEHKQRALDFMQNHENLVKIGVSVDKAYKEYKKIKNDK